MASLIIQGVAGAGAGAGGASLRRSIHRTIDISCSLDGGGRGHKDRSAWCYEQGKKTQVEQLWRDLFFSPSAWRDHRLDKANPRFPDFIHKQTQASLWLNSKWVPPWVEAKLAVTTPGTFDSSIFSWNQRLKRYAKAGKYEKARELFQQMLQEGITPDKFTFFPVLNACANLGVLEQARFIHTQIIQNGLGSHLHVGSALVDMFAKCGSMEDAWRVFSTMPTRSVVTWNAMILGYAKCGQGQQALDLAQQMLQEKVDPNRVTFLAVLNACASIGALDKGRHTHEQIIRRGYEPDIFLGSSLVDMYAKCGSIEDAELVFTKMPTRDVVTWNTMIQGYVKCGEGKKALELSRRLQQEGLDPNCITLGAVLNACASIGALEEGRKIHEEILLRGYESDAFVMNSLVDMYAKCGSIEDSLGVFNKIPTRDVVAWNAIIQGYVKCGEGQKALELSKQMQKEGVNPNPTTYLAVLNACGSMMALVDGRRVHEEIIQRGFESDVFVGTCLIGMYAKCGSVVDSRGVFDKMQKRDVRAWNAMIQGYAKGGEGWQALELFQQMQRDRLDPNPATFVTVLNACASVAALQEGRDAHEQIIQRGYESDPFVSNCLVEMYVKCGRVEDAQKVFDKMLKRDAVAWTAMIQGHLNCRNVKQALKVFQQMQGEDVDPDPVTFVAVLNACASIGALEQGRHVHEQIIGMGFESDVRVSNCLVDMYAKCGSILDSWRVFNRMPIRDVIAWNSMIQGYVNCRQGRVALELYQQMQCERVDADPMTFVAVLNACASLAALEDGRKVHAQIMQRGYALDGFVGSSLIDMYAKCGSIQDAHRVFNSMPTQDVVAWNVLIRGYVKCGEGRQALELFEQMQQDGVDPDPVTFLAVLNACASVAALEEGICAHEQIICKGYESEILSNCLVDMYAKCGRIDDSWRVFNKMPTKSVVSWNAMIQGYAHCREWFQALHLFQQMQSEGVNPDQVTFLAVLSACASVGALEEGKCAHEKIIQRGYESDLFVASSLVDMYAKCGSLEDAEGVFNKMPARNVVAWTNMILGYVKCGEGRKALEIFQQMQQEGVDPDPISFAAALKACGSISALEEGIHAHEQIIQKGHQSHVFLSNCLIDMYARCGSIEDSQKVFNKMPTKDGVTWNAMLAAYGRHGRVNEALKLFKRMCIIVDVNDLTFVSLLSACSHGGLVDEGLNYFESMSLTYNLAPKLEHYTCVIDLLGRAGHLHEAEDLIRSMPFEPDVTVWICVLGACRVHRNVEIGEEGARRLLKLDPENDAGYALLSNICVTGGQMGNTR